APRPRRRAGRGHRSRPRTERRARRVAQGLQARHRRHVREVRPHPRDARLQVQRRAAEHRGLVPQRRLRAPRLPRAGGHPRLVVVLGPDLRGASADLLSPPDLLRGHEARADLPHDVPLLRLREPGRRRL
ncbi:MAG: hypothetical protein AVDCRST_MAG30-1344, partial [uncultured Solirubrobacteraceae bacterium]